MRTSPGDNLSVVCSVTEDLLVDKYIAYVICNNVGLL